MIQIFSTNFASVPIWIVAYYLTKRCTRAKILTGSVSIEFGPQRNVSSPTDWMNSDKTRTDCGRESPSYNRVSVSVCTEYLAKKKKTEDMLDLKYYYK